MQWDDPVNSPPTTTGKSSFSNSFEKILFNSVFQRVNFWSKCSQNAESSISTNVNFSLEERGGGGAFMLNFLNLLLTNLFLTKTSV